MATKVWLDEWQVSERAAIGVTLSVGDLLTLELVALPGLDGPNDSLLPGVDYREAAGHEADPLHCHGAIEAILEIRAPYDGPNEVRGARESHSVRTAVPMHGAVDMSAPVPVGFVLSLAEFPDHLVR